MRDSVAGLSAFSADHAVTLSPAQLAALVACARAGDLRQAASLLGISRSSFTKSLTIAYRKLDVQTSIDAFRVLGWLHVPEVAA